MVGEPTPNAPNSAAIDVSTTVLLSRFVKFSRRLLASCVLISALALTVHPSLPIGAALALAVLFAVAVRQVRESILIIWTCLLLVIMVGAIVWSLRELINVGEAGVTPWLVFPLGAITLVFYCSARALQQDQLLEDDEPRQEGSMQFASMPSFPVKWLQGGYRTMFIIGVAFLTFFLSFRWNGSSACPLFAVLGTSVMIILWVLIPVLKSLRARSATALLQAVARNRVKWRRTSYAFLVLRDALIKRPLAFLGIAVLMLLLSCMLVAFVGSFVWLALFLAWVYCLRVSRRHLLRDVAKTTAIERKRFVLYLRSFVDDDAKVLRDGLLSRLWLADSPWNQQSFVRFEDVLVESIWPYDPYDKVIALGRPGDRLPGVGALRVSADSGDWQQVIAAYMKDARHIYMAVGFTSGLIWEFRTLNTPTTISKVSLIFVPESPQSILSTWRIFAGGHRDLLSQPDETIKRALAVRFQDASSPLFIVARHRSATAYKLALAICCLPLAELCELSQKRKSGRQKRPYLPSI